MGDMRVAAIFVVCVAFAAGLADDDGIAQLSETELGTPPQGGVDQQVVKAVEAKMAHAVAGGEPKGTPTAAHGAGFVKHAAKLLKHAAKAISKPKKKSKAKKVKKAIKKAKKKMKKSAKKAAKKAKKAAKKASKKPKKGK